MFTGIVEELGTVASRNGARLRIHPIRLGKMLAGHLALPPDLADRVLQAIEQEAAGSTEPGR